MKIDINNLDMEDLDELPVKQKIVKKKKKKEPTKDEDKQEDVLLRQ